METSKGKESKTDEFDLLIYVTLIEVYYHLGIEETKKSAFPLFLDSIAVHLMAFFWAHSLADMRAWLWGSPLLLFDMDTCEHVWFRHIRSSVHFHWKLHRSLYLIIWPNFNFEIIDRSLFIFSTFLYSLRIVSICCPHPYTMPCITPNTSWIFHRNTAGTYRR